MAFPGTPVGLVELRRAAGEPEFAADELNALRTLEAEVNGFLERGGGFRRSVNGLLAREHERQLDRVRQSFDRQIQAERAAEGEARRHAIQVFERFLETYPEDTERTPDVMFRLAELYYDESAYSRLAAMDDWNKKHHGQSGLIDRVRESTVTEADAEAQVLAFLQAHCHPRSAPLAENRSCAFAPPVRNSVIVAPA